MTDSRNQPEIETLSYRAPGATEQLVKPSRSTMGFNSAVIKPEMRVNKSEDAGQPLEQSSKCNCVESRHLPGAIACPDCAEIEQPNKDLMTITEIEGLFSQVSEKLYILTKPTETDTERGRLKSRALKEINLFQKTTLFELRQAFE